MSALLRFPSHPYHNNDTGISTKSKPLCLSVTYKGYKECTFSPRASRRSPLWNVDPPNENPVGIPASSSCLTEIKGLESSGMCRTLCSTSVEPPVRLSSTVPIPFTTLCSTSVEPPIGVSVRVLPKLRLVRCHMIRRARVQEPCVRFLSHKKNF